MPSRSLRTMTDGGLERRHGESEPLATREASSLPAESESMASVSVTGTGSVDRREDGGGELHPAATKALARAAAEGSRDLSESGLLCSVLLTIAVGCLGWSVPSPGASAVLAFLCMVLIAVEHTGARVRFQRAVVRAGKEHGVAAPEAERAARGLVEAAESARRGV